MHKCAYRIVELWWNQTFLAFYKGVSVLHLDCVEKNNNNNLKNKKTKNKNKKTKTTTTTTTTTKIYIYI